MEGANLFNRTNPAAVTVSQQTNVFQTLHTARRRSCGKATVAERRQGARLPAGVRRAGHDLAPGVTGQRVGRWWGAGGAVGVGVAGDALHVALLPLHLRPPAPAFRVVLI